MPSWRKKANHWPASTRPARLTVGRDRPSVPSDGQADCLSVSCVKRRRTEVSVPSNGSQRPSVGKIFLKIELESHLARGGVYRVAPDEIILRAQHQGYETPHLE